jgi:hypothetical protein
MAAKTLYKSIRAKIILYESYESYESHMSHMSHMSYTRVVQIKLFSPSYYEH